MSGSRGKIQHIRRSSCSRSQNGLQGDGCSRGRSWLFIWFSSWKREELKITVSLILLFHVGNCFCCCRVIAWSRLGGEVAKKQSSGVTQRGDEVGVVLSPLLSQVLTWDVKGYSWFAIMCGMGAPYIWVSYITTPVALLSWPSSTRAGGLESLCSVPSKPLWSWRWLCTHALAQGWDAEGHWTILGVSVLLCHAVCNWA